MEPFGRAPTGLYENPIYTAMTKPLPVSQERSVPFAAKPGPSFLDRCWDLLILAHVGSSHQGRTGFRDLEGLGQLGTLWH